MSAWTLLAEEKSKAYASASGDTHVQTRQRPDLGGGPGVVVLSTPVERRPVRPSILRRSDASWLAALPVGADFRI